MDNKKYAVQFFFNSTFQDSEILEKIIKVSDFVSIQLKGVYTKILYSSNEGRKHKTYSCKYSDETLGRIRECNFSDITAITFKKSKKKNGSQNQDIELIFLLTGKGDCPTRMLLSVDPTTQDDFSFNKLIDYVNFMTLIGLEFEYGMGLVLDEEKIPLLFLTGMATPKLSKEERDIVDALSLNIREYKTKIWDVFAYNIIKKSIVSSEMVKGINQIDNNILLETNSFYIISLSNMIDSFISDNDKYEKDRQKLRKIFSNENRIMYNT